MRNRSNQLVHKLYFRAGLLKRNSDHIYDLKVHSIRKYFKTQLMALGVNPESVLTREALSQPARTYVTAQDREDYQLKVPSQALKEALKRELLSEKQSEESTYSALER